LIVMTRQRGAALLGAIAAVALAGALWTRDEPSGLIGRRHALAESLGPDLPFSARLSGGFAPSNPNVTRSSTATTSLSPTRALPTQRRKRRRGRTCRQTRLPTSES
jgi:hypothetical protein